MESIDILKDYKELLQNHFELKRNFDYMQCIGAKYANKMNYDFNTLLNSITGYIYAVLENAEPSLKPSVEGALKTTKILTNKVNDMTDCMSLFMGAYEVNAVPTQLHLVLRRINQEIDEQLSVKRTSFEYEINGSLPEYVEMDYNAVKKIILALVQNAIQNSEDGVVKVSVDKVAETSDSITVKFCISDNGTGVDISKIKEVLNNSAKYFKNLPQGDLGGFGILMARDFLTLLSSDLKVENNGDKGVMFYFLLKLGKVSSDAESSLLYEQFDVEGAPLNGIKVLLADDSIIIQQMAKQMLEREGAAVTAVLNGSEAVASFNENKFDVILMDVEMPVLDGCNAAKQISAIKNEKNLKTPIIGMTAHTGQEEHDKCMKSGMEEIVLKPFKIEDIITAIFKTIYHKKYVAEAKDEETAKTSVYRFEKISGINYKDGLKHLGGNEKLYFELLQKFRDNYSDIFTNIYTLLKEGNDNEVKNLLHLIKGVSGNLSFNEIYDYTGKLREAVDSDNFPEVTKYLRLFDEAVEKFKQSFNAAEVEILYNMSEMEDMDLMLVKTRMDELLDYITGDVDLGNALDACDDVNDYMMGTEYKKDFLRIRDAVNSFDLELAQKLLKTFIEKFSQAS